MAAWRHLGFEGQPIVQAPDLLGLMGQMQQPITHAAAVVAGGAPVSGMSVVALGGHRVQHPETGVPALADEGFAVVVSSIARSVLTYDPLPPGPFSAMIHRGWRLLDYVESAGAIRRGQVISRRTVIQYVANQVGGVHADNLFPNVKKKRDDAEELAAELYNKISADWRNGLMYELLSIGVYLGRSEDLKKLAAAIQKASYSFQGRRPLV
ncbi:hypothetical protein [Mesorhizobium huakuii]|uniref:hypothetical protein n=1 Tax=Mesorhizobium huakuii TaxID=28104 RepID=UPI0024E051AF|nr:hypothetical protein [Mesorhizobium huakuii]